MVEYHKPSAEADLDGGLILKFWSKSSMVLGSVHEMHVSPDDVPDFIRAVTLSGIAAVSHSIAEIATGDCGTCNNFRLVNKEASGGRVEQAACPDCSLVRTEDALKNKPTWRKQES